MFPDGFIDRALKDYVDTFGQEYLNVLDGVYPEN